MRFSKGVFSTLAMLSLTTSLGVLDANASTKSTTPMLGFRYDKQAAIIKTYPLLITIRTYGTMRPLHGKRLALHGQKPIQQKLQYLPMTVALI